MTLFMNLPVIRLQPLKRNFSPTKWVIKFTKWNAIATSHAKSHEYASHWHSLYCAYYYTINYSISYAFSFSFRNSTSISICFCFGLKKNFFICEHLSDSLTFNSRQSNFIKPNISVGKDGGWKIIRYVSHMVRALFVSSCSSLLRKVSAFCLKQQKCELFSTDRFRCSSNVSNRPNDSPECYRTISFVIENAILFCAFLLSFENSLIANINFDN